MEIRNDDAYRYLLTIQSLSAAQPEKKISLQEVAEHYQVHRSTVLRALRPLRDVGFLDENYRLTESGEAWLRSDGEHIRRITEYLEKHQIEEQQAEKDALSIVSCCSRETAMLLSNIPYHCGSCQRYELQSETQWSGGPGSETLDWILSDWQGAELPVQLFFRKEQGEVIHEVSMASEGFLRTGELYLRREEERLRIKCRPVSHQSAIGRWFEGMADGLSCEHDGEWLPLKLKDGSVEIPLRYFWITMRNDRRRLRGVVRLRMGCSAGPAAMGMQTVLLEFRAWF